MNRAGCEFFDASDVLPSIEQDGGGDQDVGAAIVMRECDRADMVGASIGRVGVVFGALGETVHGGDDVTGEGEAPEGRVREEFEDSVDQHRSKPPLLEPEGDRPEQVCVLILGECVEGDPERWPG